MDVIQTDHFYVTLLSNASSNIYPENTLTSFTVHLARPIDLGSTHKWEVGICEFTCQPQYVGTFKPLRVIGDTNALIYCDLISQQFFGNKYIRCLRTFITPSTHCEHIFKNVYYMSVEKHAFQDVTIQILTLEGQPIKMPASTTPTKIVLHFRRIR